MRCICKRVSLNTPFLYVYTYFYSHIQCLLATHSNATFDITPLINLLVLKNSFALLHFKYLVHLGSLKLTVKSPLILGYVLAHCVHWTTISVLVDMVFMSISELLWPYTHLPLIRIYPHGGMMLDIVLGVTLLKALEIWEWVHKHGPWCRYRWLSISH